MRASLGCWDQGSLQPPVDAIACCEPGRACLRVRLSESGVAATPLALQPAVSMLNRACTSRWLNLVPTRLVRAPPCLQVFVAYKLRTYKQLPS